MYGNVLCDNVCVKLETQDIYGWKLKQHELILKYDAEKKIKNRTQSLTYYLVNKVKIHEYKATTHDF